MNEYSIELTPDLKGVLDSLIENTGITIDELITLGLFLYHPDIFLLLNQNNIENVKLWLFLDKTEQKWLREICECYSKTENEILLELISNNVS
ncbi:MAG: hypothetical protein HeimC2_31300 [Candidatus Heimdallarchaeota archaeon LC_2]|nr:MAG: hypothetical protein HeimC2_31300 [Candidatus Heimdallarchaeota archaeon LC_2]